ncbi:MAG: glycosyltransferase, partial [Campylobacterota bacterium]|nr:glycosyltransferase [Campylobacterota bacterium]
MKVSIIIAVYKDIDALELVLTSLKNQTYKNFEVVVVEDGSNKEIKEFLRSIDDLDIKHTAQE